MNDTINIWKSNLQASWRKLSARSIFFGASATSNGQIPMTTFYVSVAAFNNEGQVCELRIPQPFGPALLAAGAYEENQRFSTKSKSDSRT